jgi:hypothetical protein
MSTNLQANGVAPATAAKVANLPPVGSLFSAFLGYNPMEKLLGSASAAHVTPAQWATITGKKFFPNLISGPFMKGLRITLIASLVMSLIAGWASWMRGAKYVHDESGGGADSGAAGAAGAASEAGAAGVPAGSADGTNTPAPVGAFGAPAANDADPGQAPEPEQWVPA